ncbi:MAG: hypothetical protein ACRDIX_10725 [Actinomycetota bacterium]
MADRLSGLSERDLGAALAAMGRDLAFPKAPDLAAMVTRRIEEQPARPPVVERAVRLLGLPSLVRRPGRRVALALAAVLILAGGAVAGGLLVRGVRILIAPEGTSPPPAPTVSGPPGRLLFLGEESTLDQARREVDFEVGVPTAAGLPEPVAYVDDEPPGGRVSLVYPAGPGLPQTEEAGVGMLLMEFRGRVESPFLEKLVGQDQVQEVEVAGTPGYWVEGQHTVSYLDDRGTAFEERTRLAGNTLLWQQGAVTLRLESALPMEEAIRIAESMR